MGMDSEKRRQRMIAEWVKLAAKNNMMTEPNIVYPLLTVRVVALSRMKRSCTSEAEDASPGPVSPDTELYFGPNPTPRYMLQEKLCQALHMERSSE
ncbi:hypothetical protein X797_003706 [Metarhizium robertsii]|uniref:Uncharacterized protein n=1 Tax=Metarhizium robertsii TaxID=568076 RepID=A0A0A1UXE3_9HYPO|nr:hypothetical protein X797_003706 [Metarhizium robertsii]